MPTALGEGFLPCCAVLSQAANGEVSWSCELMEYAATANFC